MSKALVGSLLAALIVFIYQAMSWMALGIHDNTMKYTPQQDAILAAITANLTETGVYAIPNLPSTATQEERQAFEQSMVGKPWALVHYSATGMSGSMTPQMIFGFILNFLAAFLVAFTMVKYADKFPTFGSRLTFVLGFAMFTIIQSSLMMANWWETPWHYLSGEIIDHFVGWLLGGAVLAWWMGRQKKATA